MDEDLEMQELRAQEARRVRDEAKKCLRHASFQLVIAKQQPFGAAAHCLCEISP